jgi:hypothetical protein
MASKARTTSGVLLALLGVAGLAGAAALYWVVVPDRAQLPEDTNVTRQFDGTAAVLLNPAGLATGDMSKVLLRNVPVTAERTVNTVATDGGVAQVRDVRTLQSADGQSLGRSEAVYAVDRKTLEAAKNHPDSWTVVDHQGLTVSWPIGAEQREYVGWVSDTQSTTPIKYVGTEQRGGIDTYVYEATVAPAPIKDQQALGALPKSLPPQVAGPLLSALPLPDALKAQLAQLLPQLTSDVPLNYTYESTTKYWVEPETGVVVDADRREVRKVGMELPGGRSVPPSIAVFDVSTSMVDASVTAAAGDASESRDQLNLYGTTLPLILGGAGALLLIVAIVVLATGRRRPDSGPDSAPATVDA